MCSTLCTAALFLQQFLALAYPPIHPCRLLDLLKMLEACLMLHTAWTPSVTKGSPTSSTRRVHYSYHFAILTVQFPRSNITSSATQHMKTFWSHRTQLICAYIQSIPRSLQATLHSSTMTFTCLYSCANISQESLQKSCN